MKYALTLLLALLPGLATAFPHGEYSCAWDAEDQMDGTTWELIMHGEEDAGVSAITGKLIKTLPGITYPLPVCYQTYCVASQPERIFGGVMNVTAFAGGNGAHLLWGHVLLDGQYMELKINMSNGRNGALKYPGGGKINLVFRECAFGV